MSEYWLRDTQRCEQGRGRYNADVIYLQLTVVIECEIDKGNRRAPDDNHDAEVI